MIIDDFHIMEVGERKIFIKGLGKMFYQDGFPIGVAMHRLKEHGVEISYYHLADELQKHGWSNKTILSKLREELSDSGLLLLSVMEKIENFLLAEYEEQRAMIFEYLFESSYETAKDYFYSNYKFV